MPSTRENWESDLERDGFLVSPDMNFMAEYH